MSPSQRRNDDGFIALFRAVGLDEADDIRTFGGFRVGPGAAFVEGKWFATSFADAVRWGQRMPPVAAIRPFLVAEVRVPSRLVDACLRLPRLDGVGPAVFVRLDQLRFVNAVGAFSLVEVDRKELTP